MSDLIRPATPADIPALHMLIENAYRGDSARRGWTHEADLLGGQRTDPDMLAAMLADPDQRLLALDGANEIEGCVSLARKPGGVAYLGLLTVRPDRQAAGLGRQLLTAAECAAHEMLGCDRVEMTVIRQRSDLIAWYVRCGYVPTGERRAFPLDDVRFGIPQTRELEFIVFDKRLQRTARHPETPSASARGASVE